MILHSVEIKFDNGDGSITTCIRSPDYKWSIDGPVYPRILTLLNNISQWAKDNDLAVKLKRKEGRKSLHGKDTEDVEVNRTYDRLFKI